MSRRVWKRGRRVGTREGSGQRGEGEGERNYEVRDRRRAPNCWRRVTGDYFLIAAIKRTRSPRIGACAGTV